MTTRPAIGTNQRPVTAGEQYNERPAHAVKRRLRELGLTQTQLASATGLTASYVSDILNEKLNGSVPVIDVMLEFVGLELTARPTEDTRHMFGHWFHRDVCQYCNLDSHELRTTSKCKSSPSAKKTRKTR